ncbi:MULTISPECIES: hypothetical protein [unclassified Streptomyces]|uniref:hypothetical protein n=1 Tax=unclassified Streptomyces TaxID=2593676 RepID=UPI002E108771|nr:MULTISPECIES: hypothetical protein [unclassified Streptomyces]WSR27973.1 hypothetical protein OG573_18590 [Streptomyces sp. NBC_01205]
MTLDEAAPVTAAPRRRAAGDPVKTLLHRHRALCERAVDPLEIAAGLEVQGITDRTAARFRHRDVFSLAEELYARTPRGDEPAAPCAVRPSDARALRGFGYAVLPGAVALGASAAGVPFAGPVAVLVTVAALVWPAGPAPVSAGRFPYAALLLAAAAVGWAVHRHGTPLGVALALAAAPGYLVGAVFASRARSRLAGSRALEDFADRARPLLIAAALAFTAAATGAAAIAGTPYAVAVPLALLLFLARLLLVHGAPRGPVAAALALVLVPTPPAVAAAAAGLLVHAALVLSRASAHARH